jgi:general secretion pathway protein L
MQFGALFQRWIDVLATTYFAWWDAWRAQRTLALAWENDRFVLRKTQADDVVAQPAGDGQEQAQDQVLASFTAGDRVSAEVSHLARRSLVVLELPSDRVVVRRIAVPAQAHEFVAGIVSNQIDRLSPWHSEQVIYGFEAGVDIEDATMLDVRVLIASRAAIDVALDQIAAVGLSVDRVVASRSDPSGANAVSLWSRRVDISAEYQARVRRHIAIGIAGAVAACIALSLSAAVSAKFISGKSQDLSVRIETIRRQLEAPLTLQSAASLSPNEREWYDKEASPSVVIVIEALSRALPDAAYLTELSLQSRTLRIAGLTSNAPPLIAALEHSGSLTGVHFFAPTTRESDGGHFRFHIEGHIEPLVNVAEVQK